MSDPTYEHVIAQDNILPRFRDTITLSSALDVSGGGDFNFVYWRPDQDESSQLATLISSSPSQAAATKLVLEFAPQASDTAAENAGAWNYKWTYTPSGGTAIDLPLDVEDEPDGTPRQFLRFYVKPSR